MTCLRESIGLERVLSPVGATPYDAWSLEVEGDLQDDEISLDVAVLNLDATSFRDLWERNAHDSDAVASEVLALVRARGKMHNPRTGSGGVLMGKVTALGKNRSGEVPAGVEVVTLVSNTLIPLALSRIHEVCPKTHQIWVEGRALLARAMKYARVPDDLPRTAALSVFDVCGIVPQVQRLVSPGDRVLVIGAAGKAGLLATYAAAERVGPTGHVVALVPNIGQIRHLAALPSWVQPLVGDATQACQMVDSFQGVTHGALADIVVDCANVGGTEVGAIACCRDGAQVCFFNMATSFQAAALGAEQVGRDVRMTIGFGLLPGAPEAALALIRRHERLYAEFVRPALRGRDPEPTRAIASKDKETNACK